ncbi:aspartate aminotransferase family protein [Comamonas testosteroni]|jgi:acetylornithine aminotransferase|uniref:Acetylornithine aminotransferase n=2 Tax=Comamonas testosteroni TaxID=285 RepID=B7WYD3_COMTK|nr:MULTISPECIES: aspartate aminotransferase family protein [Comamonas]AIJ48349.1 acetylornithine aminotransferase [Comamonas testosteroni TK102]EED66066.1 acetylornithine and succinylornithine aminotransferase [Comamonas testosteroni KF-1]MPS90404.1 aspartate aminotransferase family protein [Comamonas sp.]TYK67594.1 aspartate aminotransferase family protein [Comamonas sp. Z3]WQG64332.1 aspartate aminotransferase family protein [Comamonas testosteroni]
MTAFIEAASPHVMPTYGRVPIALERGQGCRVWDVNGKEYLDALGGIAVNTLGHNHPKLVPALQDQLAKLIHTSNYYHVPGQETLAKLLTERSGMTNVFFCNTGLEANEAAIKIARKYGVDKGIAKPEIVVYDHAFHGRSIATMSATANPKVRDGFGALLDGFTRVPPNDFEALTAATEGNPHIVAVMMEPIQGEGGLHPMRADYLKKVRELCDAKGWLLIMDEVQAGMGRTGKWFAHQWAGITPDVMTLAKGLGSGVPVGAVVAHKAAAEVLKPGNHGSTFGGNPLSMRAGVETIRIMEEDGLLSHTTEVGDYLKAKLQSELGSLEGFVEVRGQGLMIGVELAKPCGELIGQAAEAGLLLSVTADTVIRLVPPLILSKAEADEIVARLKPLVQAILAA